MKSLAPWPNSLSGLALSVPFRCEEDHATVDGVRRVRERGSMAGREFDSISALDIMGCRN
jgi:hypothetical protein